MATGSTRSPRPARRRSPNSTTATIRTFTLTPERVRPAALQRKDDLRGGDAAYNAAALRAVLDGAPGAYRDTVLMNAGAGLVVAGKADDARRRRRAGRRSRSTAARAAAVLDRLVAVSNG